MISAQAIWPTVIAPVFDEPAYIPDDPLFTNGSQWYLYDTSNAVASLNIYSVWDDYSGAGVTIGIVDDGVEYDHPDLIANSAPSLGRNFVGHQQTTPDDGRPYDGDDRHGTTVAGVAVGTDNSVGIVGIAHGATVAGLRIGFNADHGTSQVHAAFIEAKNLDIVNNSWGYGGYFYDNFNDEDSFGGSANPFVAINGALIDAVSNGRPHETDAGVNLGTVFVVASGNDKLTSYTNLPDQNVNYHGFTSSPHTITVGGYIQNGTDANFSTPGAAVLLAGPSSGIKSTDRVGNPGYNWGGDYVTKSGTSYAAPAVAGVVALMLEANPDLGYRDVQEIFSLSSEFGDPNDANWMFNGADDWNGGGRHVSDELGFGTLDAFNAVRLAETWDTVSTYANLQEATVSSGAVDGIMDRNTLTHTITVADQGIDLQHVVLTLNVSHFRVGELTVTLTSPDGTTSLLINKPGGGAAYASTFIDEFELTSVQYWGEEIAGDWTVTVTDTDYNGNDSVQHTGLWSSYDLTFMGNAATDDDLYVYTSEYGRFGTETARQTLNDAAGYDTLNMATIADGVTIDLTPGAANTLRGNPFNIGASTVIEKAYGGDGADEFTGNAADNALFGMRGDDRLAGAGGDDLLDGGDGYDTAVYTGNIDDYNITLNQDSSVTIEDLVGSDGLDALVGIELVEFADAIYMVGDEIEEEDPGKPDVVLPAITHSGTPSSSEYIQGDAGANVLATGGGVWDSLDGGKGDDAYIIYNPSVSIRDSSFQGTDTIYSGAFSYNLPNFIENGIMLDNAVTLNGSFLDNYLEGNDLDNTIKGKDGDDVIEGWGGDDVLTGGPLNDVIDGGAGQDTAVFDGALADFLITEHADGTLSVLDLVGDLGMDRLSHVEFLQFTDQTIAAPDAIADPTSGVDLDPLPHPTGYAVPAPTIAKTADNFQTVTGTSGADVLWGGGGHSDTLRGNQGDDTYIITNPDTSVREYGNGGDDTVVTYVGSFSTQESIETVYMMWGAISFTGGAEGGTVFGNDHMNVVSTGGGDDVILGYAGDDILDGGDGDDALAGGAGDDQIDGGDGDDTASYVGAKADYTIVENPDNSVTVTDNAGVEGTDTLHNIETLIFADGIHLVGGSGGGGGGGEVQPGNPKPPVVLPAETHSGTGAGGEHISGDSGDNVLNGNGGSWDTLEGLGGNDSYIIQSAESLSLKEGTLDGTDTIYTDIATTFMPLHFEIAYLLDNADNISGTSFSNYIEGNDKANAIYGLGDVDELVGWGGDDRLTGGKDNDFINGGDGSDTAIFTGNLADYLIEDQGDGSFTVLDLIGNDGTDRLVQVEHLEFADQTIAAPVPSAGSASVQPLSALPGPNDIMPPTVSLSGTLESYENIHGTSGNDVLASGGGYLDTLVGKGGDDSYIVDSGSTRIKEYYNGGNDTVYSYASTLTTSASVETFYMMYGALDLTASGHDNTVYGNKHDNTINGRNGNDILIGYEGDDILKGGGGSDTAVFQGDLADFDIVWLGGTGLEVSDIAGGGQGTDSLTQIEFLQFNDQTVDAAGFFV